MWWECNDLGFACESMLTGFRRNYPHFGLEKTPFSIPQNLVHTPSEQDVKKHQDFVWREWQRCIETYARPRLSFPEKDVFAAFAGVAEKFGSLFGDDYVAGHFSSMLPIDLLWFCNRAIRPDHLLSRAPTWSWVSVSNLDSSPLLDRQQITHQGPHDFCTNSTSYKFLATVMDTRVDLVNKGNKYGPVRYAEITLKGTVLPCFRLDNHPAVTSHQDASRDRRTARFFDTNDPVAPMLNPGRRADHGPIMKHIWGLSRTASEILAPLLFELFPAEKTFLTPNVVIRPDNPKLFDLGQALALPVLQELETHVTQGILLNPTRASQEGPQKGEYYHRVGYFSVNALDMAKAMGGRSFPLGNFTII